MWFANFISIIIVAQMRIDFTPNVRVDDDTLGWSQDMPSLAINPAGDTLYCVFLDHRYGFHDFPGLTLAKSSDQGETWHENLLIYYGEWEAKVAPRIVVDSQNWLHVVFGSLSPGGVWYTRSTDGGNSWISPVMISDTSAFMQSGLAFGVDNNDNLYVMWHYFYEGVSDGDDIFFTKSMDHGATWLHPNIIVNDSVSCMNRYPSFCLSGPDTVYAVWHDNRLPPTYHIFFSRSTDGGVGWLESNSKVDPDTNYYNGSPKIDVGKSDMLYCAWVKGIGSEGYINFSKSSDNGVNWLFPVTVSDSFGQSLGLPSFALDSLENLYVVWEDWRQDSSDIFFTFSTDSGGTWYSPNVKVNDDTTQRPQRYTDILVRGADNIYVVWTDSRADTFQHSTYCGPDIYFARGSIISNLNENQSAELNNSNLQILPNPFSKFTHINLKNIASKRILELEIYNILGEFVKSFSNFKNHQSLYNNFLWDATDDHGVRVPAGVYIVILKSLNNCTTKKVIVIK